MILGIRLRPADGRGAVRGVTALLAALLATGLLAAPVLAAPPVAFDQSDSVRESKALDVFLSYSDDDFDLLTLVITTAPANGILTEDCADDGICVYTPNAGFVGTDSFQWNANDGTADSNTATFSITVTANIAPVANDQSVNVSVDTATGISFNGFDDDFDELTLVVVSGPSNGALSDCIGLFCTYTPDAGYQGPDAITWKVNDGLADSNEATMSITVAPPQCAYAPGICIDQGTVQLGINPEAHLNVLGDIASSGGTSAVGLRYLPTGAEATAPGCLCEGWGAADATSAVTGYANVSVDGGVNGMTLESFTNTASTAISTVRIGDTLRVTHDFRPSVNANLYEVEVTITNISAADVDARYRRVMDWDIEPTPFAEFVTIETGGSTALQYSSDNGFETANPLGSRTAIDFTGEAVDSGPADHGALFDFGFGTLAPSASTTFSIFYGAAATEAGALAAITQVHGEVYSLGQPSTTDGPTLGTPNTFIFAFAGVGGDPQNTPPVAVDDTASTPFETAVDIDVLGNDTDADGDTLSVTSATDPANGTTSLNPDGTIRYTPDAGFSGTDTFDYEISDGNGGTDTGTVTVTVGPGSVNPAPSADAGGPYTGTEGSATSLDGTVTNEPGTDTVTQTWTYTLGAGTDAGMTCTFGDASLVDTTITCTDDGTVTVTLSVSDGVNSPPTTDTATLTIANANPTVSITAPAAAASFLIGATVNVSATITDPGTNDTLTCSIDWGDGTAPTTGVVASGTCTGSHAYTTAGGKTITVTATDDDGGIGTDTVGITVTAPVNPAPSADAGGPYTGTEGSATSLDGTVTNEPGTDTVSQTWSYVIDTGDAGMSCAFGDASLVDTTITCTDDGTVTVTLSVSDGVNSPPTTDTATLTIANANPTVSITSPADLATVNVGATVNLTANRGDPGSNDIATSTCSIDWGDGTITVGTLTATTCTGSHVYAAIGVYTVRVTITDDDTGSAFDEIMLVVAEPGSKVTGGGWVTLPGDGKLRLGLVAQPDGAAAKGEIQVGWGKHRFHGKTVTNLVANGPNASWSGAGQYDGTTGYTYEVRIVDNGNGGGKAKTPDTFAITIRNSGGTIVFSTGPLPLKGGNLKIH